MLTLVIALSNTNPLSARKKVPEGFDRIIAFSPKQRIQNFNTEIKRTKFDSDIDEMIEGQLGDRYRRANVFDFYPLELPKRKARLLNDKAEIKLMDYYEYARNDLEKLNKSKLLKVIKMDFTNDGKYDYAIIVFDKKRKKADLAIMNYEELYYHELFQASYLEKMNNGKYPTTLVYKKGKKQKTINSPSMRLVAFDGGDEILYFEAESKKWKILALDD